MLRTHRAGKGPGGQWGWGLGSTEQKGHRHAHRLWSQRVGEPTSRLPGLKWVGQIPSAPLLLLPSWRAPPTCLSCSLPASLLHPQDQPGLEGTSESVGPGPRAGQTSPADSAGEMLGVLPPDPSPRGSLQAWEPLPNSEPPLRGASPVRPPLLPPPPQSSHVLPVRLGVLPSSLGIGVPHQHPADALVVRRRELRVFPHHHLLPVLMTIIFCAAIMG